MILLNYVLQSRIQCKNSTSYYSQYSHKCIDCGQNQDFDEYQQLCLCNQQYTQSTTHPYQCEPCNTTPNQQYAPGKLQQCYPFQYTDECQEYENIILSGSTLYCVNDTIKNYFGAEDHCEGNTKYSQDFQICYNNTDQPLTEAIQQCNTQLSVQACIYAQSQCSQLLDLTTQECNQITNISNQLNSYQNITFIPQQVILSQFDLLTEKYQNIKIYQTIFTDKGQIIYDGPLDQDLCQILQQQDSFDQMNLFRLANYDQKSRYQQFGVYKRKNEFTQVKYRNEFNQNYSIIREIYPSNWSQSCAFSQFDEQLFFNLYAIDINDNVIPLYANITRDNYTLQNINLIPLSPSDWTIKELKIQVQNNVQQLFLESIQVIYQNRSKSQTQNSLITSLTYNDPYIRATQAKNKFTFQFEILNKQSPAKIIIICLFGIYGLIMSTIKCCNNSGSYQLGMQPVKTLKIKMVNDEIQEIYGISYWHILTWVMDILSYICNGYSFTAFIGSFQLYVNTSKDKLPQQSIVKFSNSEIITMYIITTIVLIYQKIRQSKFKFFIYQTKWTDEISTNLTDCRLVYILNRLQQLQQVKPVNILLLLCLTVVFYYIYDEFYRGNYSTMGFDSVEPQYQSLSFIFIFTMSISIEYILKFFLKFIKANQFVKFEQVLGSNNLSLIIQDSQYSFTVINQQVCQSSDILEIAQEQAQRASFNIETENRVARYYLTQDFQEQPSDLLQEIQRLNAYCRFQVQNSKTKINGVKESQLFSMIHFLPDIQQIADNTRTIASGQELIVPEKLQSFLGLPWFIDINISGNKILKAQSAQISSGAFIDTCQWQRWLGGQYWWTLYIAFINISVLFYTQICHIGAIGYIIIILMYIIIQVICKNVMKQQLSYTNCVEKQWIN